MESYFSRIEGLFQSIDKIFIYFTVFFGSILQGKKLDNPTQYLRDYLAKHHRTLSVSQIYSQAHERIVYGWAHVMLQGIRWDFRMMIPRSAPENGRPLCQAVKRAGEERWIFEEDHRSVTELQQKVRVHLHEIRVGQASQFALIEVLEGTPDRITRAFRVDGDEFSQEVEVLMKVQVGRLWGMKVRFSKAEKAALNRLRQPQVV